jgi:two-component system LytT family response regulator
MRHLLADYSNVRIVDEAGNVEEAITKIHQHRPDLIFLDINMPGKNGFDLLADLDESPHVVFVTAYDEFAVRAFETNALDYLLKPVRRERLEKTMEALQESMRGPSIPPPTVQPTGKLSAESLVFIKDGDKYYFVRLADIFLIESEDNYARVYFGSEKPLHRKSLALLEEKLPPEMFFRANRQQIFNLAFITGIEPFFHGSLRVTLKGGIRVEISVRRAGAFKDLLSL